MKVLAVAYSYNGRGKSESLVAFNLVRSLEALGHEFTVLTRDRCFDENVVNFGESRYLKQSAGVGKAHKTDYFPFIRRCYEFAAQNLFRFDLIQHVSPISLRYHNPLASLDRPFVWGPVGGSIPYPPGLATARKREGLLQRLRVLDSLRLRLDPTLVATLRRSSAIVSTTTAAGRLIPRRYQPKVSVIPEGISPEEVFDEELETEDYIFSSGRLVPYKGFDLLIKAFAHCESRNVARVRISGRGPEAEYLLSLATHLGVADRVELVGQIDRNTNLEMMRRSLFCVFPALNEAFGSVNLEAMASGKAIVVTDWGGPADFVTDDVDGYKIAPSTESQYVRDLAARIDHLVEHAAERRRLEAGARATIRSYLWPNIAEQYQKVLLGCVAAPASTNGAVPGVATGKPPG